MSIINEEDSHVGIPEWFVTFSDMMSLLLTFFILLLSMSEIKRSDQFVEISDSMRQQFGYDPSSTWNLLPGWTRPSEIDLQTPSNTRQGNGKTSQRGGSDAAGPKGEYPRVTIIRPGTQTAVGAVIFFTETAAELSSQNKIDLLATAPHLGGKPQKIEVRGHTSQRPPAPGEQIADNWDLAYQRCRNTMRFLIDEMQIDPRRVRMSVAGPNEPLRFDAAATHPRPNARVEVFLLDELASEGPSEPESLPLDGPPVKADTP